MGKKIQKQLEKVDYGSATFYCKYCDYTFELDWQTIWEIQECTHGYVGFHLNDTFISCPKCNEICGDEEREVTPESKRFAPILSDDLPF